MAVERAMMFGVARTVDFTDRTNVPLAMSIDVSKVVAFEACFMVIRMITRKGGINRYTVDGAHGIDFVTEFSALEG